MAADDDADTRALQGVDGQLRGARLPPRDEGRLDARRPDRARAQLELRQPGHRSLRLPHCDVGRRHLGRRAGGRRWSGRIYVVEPTGPFEDDPNLTDKKFPGNPTRSYRTRAPLRVTGEITDWKGHPPEQLQAMRDGLARLTTQGVEAIEE
jgi:hypothetical protein